MSDDSNKLDPESGEASNPAHNTASLVSYSLVERDDGPGAELRVLTTKGELITGALSLPGLHELVWAASGLYADQSSVTAIAEMIRESQNQLRAVARAKAQIDALTIPDVVGQTIPVVIEAGDGSDKTIIGLMPLGGGSGLTVSLTPEQLGEFVEAAMGALVRVQPPEAIAVLRQRIALAAESEYHKRRDAEEAKAARAHLH